MNPDMQSSAASAFTSIYEKNAWICGSGEGSTPENTVVYRDYLQRFLSERNIRTVVDVGCGDWQFSKLIDWGSVDYLGMDVVPHLIARNRRFFGTDHIHFVLSHGAETPLPEADLLIVKDVLQHWPTSMIQSFLEKLQHFRYALITNCIAPATNSDCVLGGHRGIDLLSKPFLLRCTRVLTYNWRSQHHGDDFQKATFLYERG